MSYWVTDGPIRSMAVASMSGTQGTTSSMIFLFSATQQSVRSCPVSGLHASMSASTLGGGPLVFSFAGLVVGSVIYSLPFVVQPIQAGFEQLGRAPLEAAATLGAGPVDRFFSVALPQTLRSFLAAAVLGFAHTLGEFGVVLMIGGNIPNRTRVVSIAIYDHVETLDYAAAHQLAGILLAISFAVLLLVFALNRRRPRS